MERENDINTWQGEASGEVFILTGATGHLGNTLLRQLAKTDAKIKLLLLPNEKLISFDESRVEIARGDVCDKAFLLREIPENSVVFHLAGLIEISHDNKELLYKVNVGGVKNVVDVCLEKKVKKLIYTSSVHIIQPIKGEVLREPNEFNENKIIGDYAKSKTMATRYVMEKAKEGLNAVVVYPSGIIGGFDFKVSDVGHLLLDIINKELRVSVNGGYNFVDVRDVANGVYLAYKYGKRGEGYILSGAAVSVDTVFKIVNEKLGRQPKMPKIAMWFAKMFALLSESYAKLRRKKPLFTRYSLYTLTSNHDFCCDKAKTELGYSVRDIKDTICDAVDWLTLNKPELIKPARPLRVAKTRAKKVKKLKRVAPLKPELKKL